MFKGAEVRTFDMSKEHVIKFVCRGSTETYGENAAPISAGTYARENTREQGWCFSPWAFFYRLFCPCCGTTPSDYRTKETKIRQPHEYKPLKKDKDHKYDVNISGVNGLGGGSTKLNNYVINGGGGGCCWWPFGGGATKYELDIKTNKDTDPEYRQLQEDNDGLRATNDEAKRDRDRAGRERDAAEAAKTSAGQIGGRAESWVLGRLFQGTLGKLQGIDESYCTICRVFLPLSIPKTYRV